MRASGLFQDIMSSLFERGNARSYADKKSPINELCQDLLTERGEISGYAYAQAILDRYREMDSEGRLAFFEFLNSKMDIDDASLKQHVETYQDDPSPENYKSLTSASEPQRRELLDRINQLPGATQSLVSMRSDLLKYCKNNPALRKTDLDFQHLFRSWFNRGFLVLRQINWHTPANILEKIIEYEAVHAIDDWDDLRRRLEPEDRRCFAFFHPSIPDDPLIFVEVALCNGIPGSIQNLLSEEREVLENAKASTATFYSISNCQSGLAGISFGNSLIKQVVSDLSKEIPNLDHFVTLSPLPGFSIWLEEQVNADTDHAGGPILNATHEALENENTDLLSGYSDTLQILAANYLTGQKRTDGFPLDSVARFHLSNGALVHDIHAGADISKKGLQQSCGLMTNYLYDLKKVERNHEDFVKEGTIITSKKVDGLTKQKLA